MVLLQYAFLGLVLIVAVAGAVGWVWPRGAAWLAGSAALLLCLGLAVLARHVETVADVAWSPELGSRLLLELDALAVPMTVFVTALAALILWYTAAYLPRHLQARGLPTARQARFCAVMLAFMLAMVGLFLARDLLALFIALELTALTSFILIRFDGDSASAKAAQLTLMVTVGSSLLFLLGLLLVARSSGTTQVDELLAPRAAKVSAVAGWGLVLGVVGKSAQFPLHFWLPRAMVAPTPVSAYLHSAALVAAGVFVLARTWRLWSGIPGLDETLVSLGLASVLVGGSLALVSDALKRILAYSTIAQYGYVLVLLGCGGAAGWAGAPLFIVAHGLCKSVLFLSAGIVTETTGRKSLSETGGLWRRMPAVAAASAIAAAGLAGAPWTVGYWKDELFFVATAEQGPLLGALAVAAAAVTVTYTARFWLGIFAGGRASAAVAPVSWGLRGPVLVLAVLIVTGGLWSEAFLSVFAAAGEVVGGAPLEAALLHGGPATAWMAVLAWSVGLGLLLLREVWFGPLRRLAVSVAGWLGSDVVAMRVARVVRGASERLHHFELRDVRDNIGAVLVPMALLVVLALIGRAQWPLPALGTLRWEQGPALAAVAIAALAALGTLRTRGHVTFVVLLSFVGFSLAFAYGLTGAPDVALVLVLVETSLTLLLLAVLWQVRPHVLRRVHGSGQRLHRSAWVGGVAGLSATFVAWYALSAQRQQTVAQQHVRLADDAHAHDVVTAILADFRGLDTAGELTVLVLAVFGAAAIGWGRNP